MTTIYLIRHGEAEGNIFRRLHGQYDSLLTPRGFAQVGVLKKRFEGIRIDGCFASDLTRASLTSRAIYEPKHLPLCRDQRFREVDVGAWEDQPYGYLDNFHEKAMWTFNHNPPAWAVEGSEPFDVYTERFLEGLRDAAERFDGGTIAVFSHGAVIRGTLMRLFFMDDLSKLPYSDNTGVSKLQYDCGKITYAFLNDNSHLPESLSTFYIQRWWRATENRKESALYYVPLDSVSMPTGLKMPPVEPGGEAMAAMLLGRPVGVVSMGAPEGTIGRILGMALLPEFWGRYYGDQMLGCAFSRFRKLGCKSLRAAPGAYPDEILTRYEFDPTGCSRNIDPKIYHWDD